MTEQQRAAMQAALEALEETTALCSNYEAVEEKNGYEFTEARTVIPMGNAAIEALRAALAEPEQESVGSIHKAHLTPQDGPWCKELLLYSPDSQDYAPESRVMLYTAPPQQRQPLTEDPINKAAINVPGYGWVDIKAVRAIEAAHGIKKSK